MNAPIFSPSWYRVASLTPLLRPHARIHRQRYRGQLWYVLQDLVSERFHRFSAPTFHLIGLMDGHTTVQAIWDQTMASLGDAAPTQDEVIRLLGQLHGADVLQCDVPPDAAEIFRRRETHEQRTRWRKLMSVFAWQVPLFDPDRLVTRMMPALRPWFGLTGFVLWCVVVGAGLVAAATHWSELSRNVLDRVLAPGNLVMLWLVFPLLKLCHEFGHALAVKARGGEVHEMGVMILVLTPVPYVDASATWAFREKWARVGVGAAGMMVELFIAALALGLWLAIEPGVLRALLFNIMLIAGVSTVIFNANPLLRFDGYFMLMDALEIPNLRARSTQYLGFLFERYAFKRTDAEPPVSTSGERVWFVLFAVSSFVYRIFVIMAIVVYLGEQSLLLMAVFAGFTSVAWLVIPGWRIGSHLFGSPRLRKLRGRAVGVSGMVLVGVLALLFVLPVPLRTRAEGVVWLPDEAFARAGADGFITRVAATSGTRVHRGDLLLQTNDPELAAEVRVLTARLQELDARLRELMVSDRTKAQRVEEERAFAQGQLNRAREREGELAIVAGVDGELVLPRASDLPGRFVRKGELLAQVVDARSILVRAVVPQSDIALVRARTQQVDVRLAERVDTAVSATLLGIVPSAIRQLPSAALGPMGGGTVGVDPSDTEGRRTLQLWFQVDLQLPLQGERLHLGERAHVRFDHGYEPIGVQWARQARQLFLSRLNV
jgi:putative peptide zinc metalloprotease protein